MIKGIVFDKDGCLFDFNATWGAWSRGMIEGEAGGDPTIAAQLSDVLGYDMQGGVFHPGSIVIAETVGTVSEAIHAVIGGSRDALVARMNAAAAQVAQVEAAPLLPLFTRLRASGLRLGLATNDAESSALRHLETAGILHLFDFVAGYDSGYGSKPAAGQLLGFCKVTGLAPQDCVMVGDSLHDMHAGRAAGMRRVGVLTGPAPAAELQPDADVVLTSIASLPDWIAQQS